MRVALILNLFFAVVLGACSQAKPVAEATGPWHLLPAQSHLNFISVKKGTAVETHGFGTLSGVVGVDGKTVIMVALDSVQTNIDIRDERMRTHLFETEKYPSAKITAEINMAQFASLAIGERTYTSQDVMVNLHGIEQTTEAELTITRLGVNKIAVDSRSPVVLEVEDFGMLAGVDKLRELAELPSITPAVPVSFSLVFER